MSSARLDRKRIAVYIAFAFGIAWAAALVMYLTGWYLDPPLLVDLPGFQIPATLALLTLVYMPAPAIANILTRLVTGEGWGDAWLRPKLRQGWKYWIIAWLSPLVLTILGLVLFLLVKPELFDPSLPTIQGQLDQTAEMTGQSVPLSPWAVVIINTSAALVISVIFNSLFTFGEEFGWRAYLQQKLMPIGGRKTMLLMGIIWSIWHWPLTAMGHNYGGDYPGYPWLGFLAMTLFTFSLGTLFGWAVLRAGSVWPAVIGHAVINGVASVGILLINITPEALMTDGRGLVLLGPTPAGLIAGIPLLLVALWIMIKPGMLASFAEPGSAPDSADVLPEAPAA